MRLRTGANTTTDAQGAFRFEDVLPTIHVLNVTHAMGSASLSVDATEPPRPVVVVVTSMTVEPYTTTEQYRGHLQCASEALIISGSCDTLLGFTNDQLEPSAGRPLPEPLSRNDNFTLVTENGWETLVIDVVWDAAAYPGLDGLRVIVQGPGGRDDLGAYDKYVTAHDADGRMTIRLAPGERYESGVIQIPDQGTALDIRVLPHSYGYHEICDPDGQCFLGLGAGTDLEFQVLATTFYHEPAPPGWAHA